MELILYSLGGLACLTWSIYIRIAYSVSTAVCIDYIGIHYGLFEYEVEEYGKKRTYRNECHPFWYPKKGKRYKIFINKNNPHKIVAYNEYAFFLTVGIFLAVTPVSTSFFM